MDFSDKIILVSGGTSGIGAATARAFAREGATVVINGRDAERAASVTEDAVGLYGKIIFIRADLRKSGSAESVVRGTFNRFGSIDVLVNNAGILHRCGTLDTKPEQWHETMDLNLNAAFFMSRAAARLMKESGGGAIVNVSSELGLFADAGTVSYCVSKAAMLQMTRAFALDLAPYGIRVNAVAPGETRTAMLTSALRSRGYNLEKGLSRLAMRVPLNRVAMPCEIAEVILFLASQDASYITGATLSADGGTSAAGPGGVNDD